LNQFGYPTDDMIGAIVKKTSMPNGTTFLARQEMLNRYCAVPVLNKKKESK